MNDYKKGKFYSYYFKVQCIYCTQIYPQNEGTATEIGSKCLFGKSNLSMQQKFLSTIILALACPKQ